MAIFRINIREVFGTEDHNAPVLNEFLAVFNSLLTNSKGPQPPLMAACNISVEFPLRCLVGIPENELTEPKKRLCEGFLRHCYSIHTDAVWTQMGHWQPQNKNRKEAPLDSSFLDLQWMGSLGMSPTVISNVVLYQSTAIENLNKKFPDRNNLLFQNTRMKLAIAVFGFRDPAQFFTAKK